MLTRKERKREEKASGKKKLHGQRCRQTKEIGAKDSWTWLQKGELKKETERVLMAAQSQSLRINAIKGRIDKSREDAKYKMCSENDETIHHILSGCSNLGQKEYKRRHDCLSFGIFNVNEDLKLVVSGTNLNMRL